MIDAVMEEVNQTNTEESHTTEEPNMVEAPTEPAVVQTETVELPTEPVGTPVETEPAGAAAANEDTLRQAQGDMKHEAAAPAEPAELVEVVQTGVGMPVVETSQEEAVPPGQVAPPETVIMPEPVQVVEPAPPSSPPVVEEDILRQPFDLAQGDKVEIKEKVVERVRELNEGEKEQIFKDKLKTLSPRGVSARRAKKQANLDKILSFLRQHGYITNDEVEELCKVKNSAAAKYLEDLEKQGLVVQLGKTGRNVRYRLTEAIPGNIH